MSMIKLRNSFLYIVIAALCLTTFSLKSGSSFSCFSNYIPITKIVTCKFLKETGSFFGYFCCKIRIAKPLSATLTGIIFDMSLFLAG